MPKAWLDMERIDRWYTENQGHESALKVIETLGTAMRRLETFPDSGVLVNNRELKSLNWRQINCRPYVIFYKKEDKIVKIHRIIDTRREDPFVLLRDGAED